MSIGLNVLGLDALGLDALGLNVLGLDALGLNALGLKDLGLNDQTLVSLKTTNVYNEEQGCVCGGEGGTRCPLNHTCSSSYQKDLKIIS